MPIMRVFNLFKHVRNLQPERVDIFKFVRKLLQAVVIAVANYRRIIVVHFEPGLSLEWYGKFLKNSHPKNPTATTHVDHTLRLTQVGIEPFGEQLFGHLVVEREVDFGKAVDIGIGEEAWGWREQLVKYLLVMFGFGSDWEVQLVVLEGVFADSLPYVVLVFIE